MKQAKCPDKSLKKARDKNLLTAYCYYMKLKCIKTNGIFARGDMYLVSEAFGVKKSRASQIKRILINSGFATPYKKGFRLIRYNYVWDILGIENKKSKKNKRTKRKSKIYTKGCYKTVYNEKTGYTRYDRVPILKVDLGEASNVNEILESVLLASIKHKQNQYRTRVENDSRRKKQVEKFNLNLSCKGIAYMLGKRSARTGKRYRDKLSSRNRLKVKNNKILLKKGVSYEEFLEEYLKENSKCHFRKRKSGVGDVYIINCSTVSAIKKVANLEPEKSKIHITNDKASQSFSI